MIASEGNLARKMVQSPSWLGRATALILSAAFATGASAQVPDSARARWEQLCAIRQEKFDQVLPQVMRANKIDMWIVTLDGGTFDANSALLGGGYPGDNGGVYVFADKGGGRIDRAVFGIVGELLTDCPTYDVVGRRSDFRAFVAAHDPKRIGLNMSTAIGTADGLSYTGHATLARELGPAFAARFVSAEKLVSDFRSTHVPGEIYNFSQAGEMSRELVERALSNEVITPDKTTLADVAWWLMEQLKLRGLESSFGLPSVYVAGPVESDVSNGHVIRRGELLAIDWGLVYQQQHTDMKRLAYVLKPGEEAVPAGVQRAFDKAVAVRSLIMSSLRPGVTAKDALDELNRRVGHMPGYAIVPYGTTTADPNVTDVIIGSHSTGDEGHGSGPSVADFQPVQLTYMLRPGNFLSIEFFTYTRVPEWGEHKITIPLEDDAIITGSGVSFAYPANSHILLIK